MTARKSPADSLTPEARHGISHTTMREIWQAFGLKPWQQDAVKVSPDSELVRKIRDLVAL
jgi:hypothetical protein